MSEIEQKTTAISEDGFHPLEVEWNYHKHHYVMVEGQSVQQPQHHVTLVYPGNAFEKKRTRIINLAPKTALNLLAWLEREQEMLKQLVESEVQR